MAARRTMDLVYEQRIIEYDRKIQYKIMVGMNLHGILAIGGLRWENRDCVSIESAANTVDMRRCS